MQKVKTFSTIAERQNINKFRSLMTAWIDFTMLPTSANDIDDTCYRYSGRPHFIHINSVENDIVAATTITSDARCKSQDKDLLHTPARDFVGGFVTLHSQHADATRTPRAALTQRNIARHRNPYARTVPSRACCGG